MTANQDAKILELACVVILRRARKPQSIGIRVITNVLRSFAHDIREGKR